MTVHRVLVQGDQHVVFIAHAAHGAIAGADGEKRVAPANDGLVGVVGVNVEATAGEDARQNITSARDALPVFTTNPNCKVDGSHYGPFSSKINSPNHLN